MAWKKLFLSAVRMSVITALCWRMWKFGSWPQLEGEFLYYVITCRIILAFFWWQQVLSYIFGFFVCCFCRRLKKAKNMSAVVVEGGTGCDYCAGIAEVIRENREMHVTSPHPFEKNGQPLSKPLAPPVINRPLNFTGMAR